MSDSNSDIPKLGEMVYYYDEDKQPLPGLIAYLYPTITSPSGRPTCNITIIRRDANFAPRIKVEPAYHNGERWILINKWSFPDEVPEDEYNYLPIPKVKGMSVGSTSSQIIISSPKL